MKAKRMLIPLKVGSRSSRLARVQVVEIFTLLGKAGRKVHYEPVTFETKGDVDKTTSLLTSPADDFFTNTLDESLLSGKIDIAIHSAKDLPKSIPAGLKIFAFTQSLDDSDAFVGRVSLAKLPAGSRIGTSSLLRKDGILNLNPNVKIVDIRGTIEERLKLLDEGKYDGVIIATCALKRLGLAKRIKEIMPWEGTPLQGQLAIVGRSEDSKLEAIFSVLDVRNKYGQVYLVGAGPGDPDLITVKGVKILKNADCVFYDYLVHERLLDYAPFAEKINVGKRKGNATLPQKELSKLLKKYALSGKNVVRLKGGDPLIFGRGADEIEYLSAYHIPVHVIPGITSATGIPSALGIPLTARGISSSVAFLSGHGEDEKSENPSPIHIPETDTLVFLMGLTKLKEIVATLKAQKWANNTPIMLISKGTRIEQKIVMGTLADIEEKVEKEGIHPPALIVVGKTINFYKPSQADKNILYLGIYPEKYKNMGRLIHFPMIQISPARVASPRRVLSDVKKADMILLTSRCGVRYFIEFLKAQKFNMELLKTKDFIVIGRDTEEQLNMFGYFAKLVSKDETSEGLFKTMKKNLKLKGASIIFPRSSIANPYLKTHLAKAGAKIKEVIVYQNTKPERRELPGEKIDAVIFTSPSILDNFIKDHGFIPFGWHIFAKGTRTQRALREAGYSSEILVTD